VDIVAEPDIFVAHQGELQHIYENMFSQILIHQNRLMRPAPHVAGCHENVERLGRAGREHCVRRFRQLRIKSKDKRQKKASRTMFQEAFFYFSHPMLRAIVLNTS